MVLGQVKTDEKSNEITAIPKLLQLLKLDGATVTIDAMGCQKDIVRTITEGQADFIIAVKDNQPKLFDAVTSSFAAATETDVANAEMDITETENAGHGRRETRRCLTYKNVSARSSRSRRWRLRM
jgi:predicted transposase YbfD/YdcC